MPLFLEERGRGKPVVFVHGALEDYRAWSAQIEDFSRSWRAIAYSRRCSYPNQNPGDVLREDTVENNMADLVALLAKLDIAPAHVVAHSYGGFIAAYLAFKHPELVRSLVLVEPGITTLFIHYPNSLLQLLGFFFRYPSVAIATLGFARATQSAIGAYDQGDAERAARIFVDEIQAKSNGFDELPEAARKMMAENAKTLLDLRIVPPDFSRSQARKVKTPTLIIKGQTSHKLLQDIANALSGCLPNSQLVTIAKAGHFSQVERPEEFNSLVQTFLSRQS